MPRVSRDEFIAKRDALFEQYSRCHPGLGFLQVRQMVSQALTTLGFTVDPVQPTSWAAKYLNQSTHWKTHDGRLFAIRDLNTEHIENILKWLVQKSYVQHAPIREELDRLYPSKTAPYSERVRQTKVYKALRQERIKRYAQELDRMVDGGLEAKAKAGWPIDTEPSYYEAKDY